MEQARARLEALGAVVLEASEDSALVLADADQLEALARLRFEPRATDALGGLVADHCRWNSTAQASIA